MQPESLSKGARGCGTESVRTAVPNSSRAWTTSLLHLLYRVKLSGDAT